MRVALTYFSEVAHDFDTTTDGAYHEVLKLTIPQAVNLDFHTGIAKDTLLFGSTSQKTAAVIITSPKVAVYVCCSESRS